MSRLSNAWVTRIFRLGWGAVVVGGVAFCIACAGPTVLEVENIDISIARDARAVERILLDLDLGTPGSRAALRSGWSWNEKGDGRSFVWGIGAASTMEFELEVASDLNLHLAGQPFPDKRTQVVTVEFNGETLGSFSLREGWQTVPETVFIPEELVNPGVNQVAFRYGRFREAKDSKGRSLRRYAVAWDRIRLSRPSRIERSGVDLFLPAGETVSIVLQSVGPTRIRIDELLADPGAQGLEIRSKLVAQRTASALLATLGEGADFEIAVTEGQALVELLLTSRGAPKSGIRLLNPRIHGQGTKAAPPNVVLISVDTLRADHLAVYGYDRETAPALSSLSKDSVLFEEAISQGPSTLISHASLFSSLIPQHHGASFHYRRPLPEEVETLAEVLQRSGHRCGSVNGGGQIDPAFGLDQGFGLYEPWGGYFFDAVQKGAAWIDQDRSEPFFLFLHTYEVHHPYRPRLEDLESYDEQYAGSLPMHISKELLEGINRGEVNLDDADLRHIMATYDALIRSMDRGLEWLIGYLRSNGLYDSTLIVFTSDHGEEFGEHGWVGWHSHSLFDELLRVPLIIKLPFSEGGGGVVSHQVRSIDVAPTILDILNIEIPESYDGQSLLPAIEGSPLPSLPAVAMIDQENEGIWSIRWEGQKWYRGMLFDLARDPEEKTDLAPRDPRRARELRSILDKMILSRDPLSSGPVRFSDDTEDRLRALGYL